MEAQRRLREVGIDVNADLGGTTQDPARKARTSALNKEQREKRKESLLATEQQRQQEFEIAFRKLDLLEDQVDAGDPEATTEWLEVATQVVDAFRETRQLFPADLRKKFTGVLSRTWKRKGAKETDIDAQADEMVSRLQRTMSGLSLLAKERSHAETNEYRHRG
jgi:general transcription factor 3C polypeptide 3 (transcription factor C subunit 4)